MSIDPFSYSSGEAQKRQRGTTYESSSRSEPASLITAAYHIAIIENQIQQAQQLNEATQGQLRASIRDGHGEEVISSLAKTFAFGSEHFARNPSIVLDLFKFASKEDFPMEALLNHYRSNGFGSLKARLLSFTDVSPKTLYPLPEPVCSFIGHPTESPIKALVQVLKTDTSLTGLTVRASGITKPEDDYRIPASQLPPLLTAIAQHQHLTSVCFLGDVFDSECAPFISPFIPNFRFSELSFNTTPLMNLKSYIQIIDAMTINSKITSLRLISFCGLGRLNLEDTRIALGVLEKSFTRFFLCNTTVTKFDLRDNSIHQIGGFIARSLHLNHKLTSIQLSNSWLQTDDIFKILQAVKDSKVTFLNISGHQCLSNECYEQVGNLLLENSVLEELYISSRDRLQQNAITDDAVNDPVAMGLLRNTALKVLDLSHNCIPSDSKIQIAESLRGNFTLKSLFLDETSEPEEHVLTAFEKTFANNYTLSTFSLSYRAQVFEPSTRLPGTLESVYRLVHHPRMIERQREILHRQDLLEASLFEMLKSRLFF